MIGYVKYGSKDTWIIQSAKNILVNLAFLPRDRQVIEMETTLLLQNWFSVNKRPLPWRDTYAPYCIWLSEIILQQTQVAQGLDYYLKFLREYPDVHHLAAASENEVLKSWQGLGYYSRARNLYATAMYISRERAGCFPDTLEGLLSLKGVGPYTAAAIASIAFKVPVAAVDGNVYRVLSRLFDVEVPLDSAVGKKLFQQLADEVLDKDNPGDHNQAMMELGALVCTPLRPRCDVCPLRQKCQAFANGTVAQRPVKGKKLKPVQRQLNYLVVHNSHEILLKKRGPGDIWQGLHDFPELNTDPSSAGSAMNQLENMLPQKDLPELKRAVIYEPTEVYSHKLSHQNISARFWKVKMDADLKSVSLYLPVNKKELETIPVPRLIQKFLEKEPDIL